MNYLRYVLAVCFIICLSASCKKNKPPVGDYVLATNWTIPLLSGDSTAASESTTVRIIESSKSEIKISYDFSHYQLSKDNRNISGSFKVRLSAPDGVYRYYDPININGKWDKQCGNYQITGDFDATYRWKYMNDEGEVVSGSSPLSGQFSIFAQE